MENLSPFELNVIQVALAHLKEMHDDIMEEDPPFHGEVVDTCEQLLINLKSNK
jgi:hypothetical protein